METPVKNQTVVHYFVHYSDDLGRARTIGPYSNESSAKLAGHNLQRMFVISNDQNQQTQHYGQNL